MEGNLNKRIENLVKLADVLRHDSAVEELLYKASKLNPWFTEEYGRKALDAITDKMLDAAKLREWMARYDLSVQLDTDKTIGLIMAGNLPLVGFHDFLCVYMMGYKMRIKLSAKDDALFPYVIARLNEIDSDLSARMIVAERLEGFDAVIATGSNNSNRYFEYYFRNYPKILRRSRNSVAVLNGNESPAELYGLADDIFMYFGFGCRNVSKLFVPQEYDVRVLFPYFEKYKWMHAHTKYMNNYDYNRTLLLLNATEHLGDEIVMLQEHTSISSPIGLVYYERYGDMASVKENLIENGDKIQCVVATDSTAKALSISDFVPFGKTQKPELWDYADGVDTIKFLISLKSL